jgi:cardiolipin synthase
VSLPNLISLARLLAVPLAIYLILSGLYAASFWLFVAAGVSDAVDGFLAKKFGQTSTLGAYLDPLADKALLVGVCVTLGYTGHLPTWLVILVAFRDVVIIGGVILLHISSQSVRMRPLVVSKVNTAAQIALVAVVLGELGVGAGPGMIRDALVWLAGGTTVLSGGAYLVQWFRLEARTAGDGP